jgi:alpha-aminoadipic semialdehyde synthase
MAGILGIRREDRNPYERRAPLSPSHVERLVKEHDIKVVIQPSDIRVFTDRQYADAGAVVQEDLSGCDVLIAVKEIPESMFRPGGTYMCFSHTIKGQDYNMPALGKLVELRCDLMDYEKVTDDKGRRLIFFGREAGLAGMLNTLWALGERLRWEGHVTPLVSVESTKDYPDLGAAEAAIVAIGHRIAEEGMPEAVGPLVCGFAGYGNVSNGAQEIFNLLPMEELTPEELVRKGEDGTLLDLPRTKVYKVVFKEEDMVEPASPDGTFELQDYYDNPEKYRGIFVGYLPHLTLLVNCIYWTEAYPRLVTLDWLREAYPAEGEPRTRLKVIGDISCDIDGSVQCTVKGTDPGNPIYVYDPVAEKETDGFEGRGPVIMAIDALPSSLPADATVAFGEMLMPYVPGIMGNDFAKALAEQTLPPEISRAHILHRGVFTPDFGYMAKFVE